VSISITLKFAAHGCKNFKKKLEKMAKKHSEIKQLSIRCSKTMANIITSSKGNYVLFMEKIEKKMNHYCNDHRMCDTPSACNKVAVILNTDAQLAFKVIKIQLMSTVAESLDGFCRIV
jgi:hypothetical protein